MNGYKHHARHDGAEKNDPAPRHAIRDKNSGMDCPGAVNLVLKSDSSDAAMRDSFRTGWDLNVDGCAILAQSYPLGNCSVGYEFQNEYLKSSRIILKLDGETTVEGKERSVAVIKGTEFDVFPLNLGGNSFGWTSDRESTFAVLDAFVEAGGNFVDTADSYSAWAKGNEGGESEREIGAWLKERGTDNLIIATKSGGLNGVNGRSRKATFDAVEGSLERLGVEAIDIFYYHFDDEDVSIDEQVEIANDLIAQGKIKHLALSNYTPERLRAFFAKSEGMPAQPIALQPHYNLLARKDYENGIWPIVEKHDVAVFPYFSLAAGLLTGKYASKEEIAGKQRTGQLEGYATDEAFAVVDELRAVAKELNAAPTTVALAWLIEHGVTAPIASVSRADQLNDLMAVKDLKLSAAQLARLDKVSEPFA